MYWQFRYLRNTLIAFVTGYQRLRRIKRTVLPYDASLDEWTLEQGLQMIDLLARAGRGLHGATVLELGSGWKPVIALLFRLAGAERVILTDAERLLVPGFLPPRPGSSLSGRSCFRRALG